MNLRQLPNAISLVRILLVFPYVWCLAHHRYGDALILFIVAGLSDGVDGYLARRFSWTSRLGSILDPIGDKMLLVSAFFTLGWLGVFPPWLVALVIGRDLIIVSGAVAYHFVVHRYEMRPTLISKFNTLMQLLLVSAVMIALAGAPLPEWVTLALVYVVMVTTLVSGIEYVWVWGRRACRLRCGE